MKKIRKMSLVLVLAAAVAASALVGCSLGSGTNNPAPLVTSTSAVDGAIDVHVTSNTSATFDMEMDPLTITRGSFSVEQTGRTPIPGVVNYDVPSKTAYFVPSSNLIVDTSYTARISTNVKSTLGERMQTSKVWTFTTTAGNGPTPVSLGAAGNFAILAKTAITNIATSSITGDVGISPSALASVTGFVLTLAGTHATAPEVNGFIYAADMAVPTPANMTTAILNMQAAYTDAAGRLLPDFLNLGSGNIGGLTLAPGLYKWTSTVTIPTSVTLLGSAEDVWIFQITGDLTPASSANVVLSGGAQAKNVFWQVAGQATLGTNSHFEGVILSQTAITLQTNATMVGRALAQSQVALDHGTLTNP